MATIKDLLQLDISKIGNEKLQEQVQQIISDHKEAKDKEDFIGVYQPTIDQAYTLVEKFAPDAIQKETKENPCEEITDQNPVKKVKSSTATKKKKSGNATKKNKGSTTTRKNKSGDATKNNKRGNDTASATKMTLQDVKGLDKEIQQCRIKIKKYNEERRKNQPEKKPVSRYIKIRNHILALGRLIPPGLKDDLDTQKKTKRVLIKAHRELLNTFNMTSLRNIDRDQKEIKEKFEKIEEKLEA
ncbi:hypothetical protein [Aquimarina latercula]|uniref:hypothetical protein n=1 Tax=Aquimarina latercula TaxID=987 RepID=UPI00054DC2FE|nr:hypothetical protein [Aquimarina latercula]